MRRPIRLSIWILFMAICTAIAGLYGGARWAAITPSVCMAFFVPMVLMPLKPSQRN